MRAISFLAAGTLLIFLPALAGAQTDLERATAREAANTGRAQFEAGHYAEAIDSFNRAQQLVAAPPHLLYIARAQMKLGKLVEAHESYLKITREPLPAKAPKAFQDAESAAERELDALDARLPSVTVTVRGAPAAGVSMQLDGADLPSAMIGIPFPVDPGAHVFVAHTASASSPPVNLTSLEGGKDSVILTLPAQTSAPSGNPPSKLTGEPLAADAADSGASHSGLGSRIASVVAFGVGAAGLSVGAYYLVKSNNTRKPATQEYNACLLSFTDGRCHDPTVESSVLAIDHEADKQQHIGIGALVVGGVGVAAGVTLLILSASSSDSPTQAVQPRITPWVGLRSLGVSGTF